MWALTLFCLGSWQENLFSNERPPRLSGLRLGEVLGGTSTPIISEAGSWNSCFQSPASPGSRRLESASNLLLHGPRICFKPPPFNKSSSTSPAQSAGIRRLWFHPTYGASGFIRQHCDLQYWHKYKLISKYFHYDRFNSVYDKFIVKVFRHIRFDSVGIQFSLFSTLSPCFTIRPCRQQG